MAKFAEPFGDVPKRLADHLSAGELTWDEFAVLAWLELRVNYRVSPPIWRGTTRDLVAAMRWSHTPAYLSIVLRRLHTRGWIESTAKPRSPKPYTLRCCGVPPPEPATHCQPTGNRLATVVRLELTQFRCHLRVRHRLLFVGPVQA
jgi:hypothetical protein